MDILIESKEIKLGDQTLTLRRRGIAYYFQLIYWDLKCVYHRLEIGETTRQKINDADLKAAILEKTRKLYEAEAEFKRFLGEFTDAELSKLSDEEIRRLFRETIRFNQAETRRESEGDVGDRKRRNPYEAWEIQDYLEDTENLFYYTLSQLAFATGWPIRQICEEVNHVEAFYLMNNYRIKRSEDILDQAQAARGERLKEYISQIKGLES